MSTIDLDKRDDGVCVLTLNSPPANALNEALLTDLTASLQQVREDDAVRALVLTGKGEFFSAGFDFSVARRAAAEALQFHGLYQQSQLDLLTLPKPTVAMVQGHAVAGGLVMALACDTRLGREGEYRIGLTEIVAGASFPRIAFEIVRLRLSHRCAAELLLEARLHSASQATRLGVVDKLLGAEALEKQVMRYAARLGRLPREAYAHTKALLVEDAVARVRAETDEDVTRMMDAWRTPESRAARAAMQRKLGLREES
jgi:enoyl-CoA hydratase